MDYGVSNDSGQISNSEIEKILDTAISSNIEWIDTAADYGNAEIILGRYPLSKFKVITKLKLKPNIYEKELIKNYVKASVSESIERMKLLNIYGVMLHNPHELNSSQKQFFFEALEELQSEKIIFKFGLSLYEPPTNLGNFTDLLQLPGNAFDNRAFRFLDAIPDKRRQLVFIRSIFLQGLLIIENYKEHNFAKKWSEFLDPWHEYLKGLSISPKQAAVWHVLNKCQGSNLVIGVQSAKQFLEILDIYRNREEFEYFGSSISSNLYDPRNW